jgi:hypothetical protein
MKTKISFLLLFLFSICTLHVSAQHLMWAKTLGALRPNDVAYAVASDNHGNVITTGTFQDTADLDPSKGQQWFIAQGQEDVFITKLDSNGLYLWSKQIGGVQGDFGYAITTDANDNIYVAGSFSNRCDFNVGGTSYNIMSQGFSDAFVAKYNANGTLLWVKSFGGISAEEVFAIALKPNGNILLGGYFMGFCDFDPGASSHILNPIGVQDAFVNELDSNGNFIQAFAVSGALKECIYGICSDYRNNIFISGYFEGSADFDPSNTIYNLSSAGGSFDKDFFLAKYTPNGTLLWAKNGGGIFADMAFGLCVDHKQNVLTTGWFETQADFDPSNATYSVNTYAGTNDRDAFIWKLDSTGTFKWVAPLGGTDIQTGYGIACDPQNNIYTAGFNKDSMDIDPSANKTMIVSKGDFDIYVHSLDENGNVRWGFDIGGPTDDGANALCLDINDNVLVVGGTSDTTDFDPNTSDTFNIQTQYLYDAFIAKYGACHQPYLLYSNYEPEICAGHGSLVQLHGTAGSSATWLITGPLPLGSQGWNFSTNTFNFSPPKSGDYIVQPSSFCYGYFSDTLHLHIDTVNANFNTNPQYTLIAQDTQLMNYQWMECTISGMQAINGATNFSFQPLHSGNYALIAQDSLCSDTSACISFIALQSEALTNATITIQKNGDNIHITHSNSCLLNVTIFNTLGELVWSGHNKESSFTINCATWVAGIYLINCQEENRATSERIIITN